MNYKKMISLIVVSFFCIQAKEADFIIFSYDRPLQLWALLESMQKNVTNVGDVYVIYRASSDFVECAYKEVEKSFNDVIYIPQSENPQKDFKYLTMQCLHTCINDYVLFAVDDIVVTGAIDLDECVKELEAAHAYAFYLRLGLNLHKCYSLNRVQKVPHGEVKKGDFYVWKFSEGECDWNYPHSVDMTIFKRDSVIQQLNRLNFTSPNTLEAAWAGRTGYTYGAKGICFVQSRIINLPLNRVQNDYHNRHMSFLSTQELLSLFYAGLKMDINPLQGYVNESAHMEYIPTFILRDEHAE